MIRNKASSCRSTADFIGRVLGAGTVTLALVFSFLIRTEPMLAADKEVTGDRIATADGDLIIQPINHATLVLGWKGKSV